MRFIKVNGVKLGNMRKAKDWVVTPSAEIANGIVVMQSDNRITKINLYTGRGFLSDGKNGHQGFAKLNPAFGAVVIDVPDDVIAKITSAVHNRTDYHGPVNVTALSNAG